MIGKQKLIAIVALLAIIISCAWIFFRNYGGSKINVELHQGVGRVMAQETARVLEKKGKIVVIAVEGSEFPDVKVQLKAFEKALKNSGQFKIKQIVMLDTQGNPKYRAGSGLSAKHFLKIFNKYNKLDGIVSFVGTPMLSDDEITKLGKHPKFIAEAKSPEKLAKLFAKNVLQTAIVPRFDFPAPGNKTPETPAEWFEMEFQVLRDSKDLPVPDKK